MPDTHSPKVASTEEDLPIMLFENDSEQTVSRKWSCPGDYTIAAYADGGLDRITKAWVEFHLSNCLRCRLLVADVVKEQRESDLPVPPVQLVQKAMELVERRRVTRRWVWVRAGALAGIALLAIVTLVLRKSQQLVVIPPSAPAAPLVAKSEPPPIPHTRVKNVVRKPATPELLPTILSPQTDSIMQSDELQFRWKPIPESHNYEVRVVRSDGDVVWEGQTDKSALQVPTEVVLENGSYFIWITAHLENGRTAKSAPVRFLVKR
jgi:Putative zinc-finger